MTALHIACRNVPPSDIIDVLLSIAVDTAQWQDSFGWLPIHYACACGADPKVIQSLAEAFPESKATVDRRGRTPLHFALGNSNPDSPVSPSVVVLLSSTGAASFADDNGMLVSSVLFSLKGALLQNVASTFPIRVFLMVLCPFAYTPTHLCPATSLRLCLRSFRGSPLCSHGCLR